MSYTSIRVPMIPRRTPIVPEELYGFLQDVIDVLNETRNFVKGVRDFHEDATDFPFVSQGP